MTHRPKYLQDSCKVGEHYYTPYIIAAGGGGGNAEAEATTGPRHGRGEIPTRVSDSQLSLLAMMLHLPKSYAQVKSTIGACRQ